MRISFIHLIVTILLSGVAIAGDTQGLDSIYVTIGSKHESLEALFKKIESQTRLRVAYQIPQVEKYTDLSFEEKKRSVKATLELALANIPLTYTFDGNVIVFTQTGSQQNTNIRSVEIAGTVTGRDGIGMPGVNIAIKGTFNGTSTDADGKYQLTVILSGVEGEEGNTLVFSSIGNKKQEIKIGNQSVIDVVMEEDATTLGEVEVNGGYYTTTKATSTGNIEQVKAKDITRQPVVNVLQALQGKMAGVEITQIDGTPGAPMVIKIRGTNSLQGALGNLPLIIIDGVPIPAAPFNAGGIMGGSDALNTINPENIESFEVLKDADATSIYGSRGANGVILITTKKAAKDQLGRTGLEASYYTGFGQVNKMKLLNSKQYLEMRRQAFANDGKVPTSTPGTLNYAPDLTVWDTTRYTDWQEELFGETAHTTDVQVALTGGNAFTSFRANIGYHHETLTYPGDFRYKRLSGGLTADHRSKNNRFTASFTMNYGRDDNKLPDNGTPVATALTLPPVAPKVYSADGSLNWELDANGKSTWDNPMAIMQRDYSIKGSSMISNMVLQYEIISGLKLKTALGFSNSSSDGSLNLPYSSMDPSNMLSENSTLVTQANNQSWNIEPVLTYSKNIGKGTLDVLVGSTWQANDGDYLNVTGSDYATDRQLGSLMGAARLNVYASSATQYRYASLFSRVSWNWKEKYLVNLTGRRDGSSRFGPEQRFANFYAVGLGWVFSEENFFNGNAEQSRRAGILSFGKLRASYGTTGSDAIGDYQFLDAYKGTDYEYDGISGIIPAYLPNPGYQWELVKKLEAGLELGFFKDRIALSASWYFNQATDQLVGNPLSTVTGFNSITDNQNAVVQNTGIELVLNTVNIQSSAVHWTSSFNLTIPHNKLVSYEGLEFTSDQAGLVIGKPLGTSKAYHYLGINPQTGLYEVEDVNGDGFYTIEDQTSLVRAGRRWYGGFSNSLTYGEWQFGFTFEFVKQYGDLTPSGGPGVYRRPGLLGFSGAGNQPVDVLKRWQGEGDNTNIQRYSTGNIEYNLMMTSDGGLGFADISFLRLKTVSLSYNLPQKSLTKINLLSCNVFVSAQNLLTITKYLGLDPQSPSGYSLPALKMISTGVKITL